MSNLKTVGTTKKSIKLTGYELTEAIAKLRTELIKKGEATEMFATERQQGSIQGIVGNVTQSFGGQPVYRTLEEKAAHLLYFVVKTILLLTATSARALLPLFGFCAKPALKAPATLIRPV